MDDFMKRFVEARQNVVRSDFAQLNNRQLDAVLATEGPLLILAGAGSGKTTVLINRIANLLKYGCLAITFTNKAAGELKERLGRMLGEKADDIWACTFHSACVRMLRRDAEKLGFPSNFTIYDTSDSQSLAKKIIKELNLDEKSFPFKSVLAEISRAKDAGICAAEYLKQAQSSGDFRRIRIGQIYVEYMRRMFGAGAMDFDDLLFFTVKLLQEDEEVRLYWQRRFQYVLIDEYQDTNRLQYLYASSRAAGAISASWATTTRASTNFAARQSRTSSPLRTSSETAA